MAQDDVDVQQQKKGVSSKFRDCGLWIWNPQKKEFIGRSGTSWLKIGVFYLIFYGCLAGFFAAMLAGFFTTLDDSAPTQQNMYSLIKSNPGMGFRPMPNVESTLISFDANKEETYKKYVDNIKEFLKEHNEKIQGANYTDCQDGVSPEKGSVCEFDMTKLGDECTEENNFGYSNGTPCVLLKINRVYNWAPETFECNKSISEETAHAQEGRKALKDRCTYDHVGITCEGESESDSDNLQDVDFYPTEGYSKAFFPYLNTKGYQSPLVFARFTKVKHGALIQVWCKLWAYNIKHHKNDKAGSIHFELLVDKKP